MKDNEWTVQKLNRTDSLHKNFINANYKYVTLNQDLIWNKKRSVEYKY